MRSEESKAAQKAYEKTMTRSIGLKLNKSTDADVIRWLELQPNIQGYIKGLIRNDMGGAEMNALQTMAQADRISELLETAPEEEQEALLEQMPEAGSMMDAKRIHEIRTSVELTPTERHRIQSISVWGLHRQEVADIKQRTGLTWSQMEMVWKGLLKI